MVEPIWQRFELVEAADGPNWIISNPASAVERAERVLHPMGAFSLPERWMALAWNPNSIILLHFKKGFQARMVTAARHQPRHNIRYQQYPCYHTTQSFMEEGQQAWTGHHSHVSLQYIQHAQRQAVPPSYQLDEGFIFLKQVYRKLHFTLLPSLMASTVLSGPVFFYWTKI